MKISIDSNLLILLMIVMPVCVYIIITLIFEGIKSARARRYEWLEVSEGRYVCPRCSSIRIYKRKSSYCPDCGIELVHVIGKSRNHVSEVKHDNQFEDR